MCASSRIGGMNSAAEPLGVRGSWLRCARSRGAVLSPVSPWRSCKPRRSTAAPRPPSPGLAPPRRPEVRGGAGWLKVPQGWVLGQVSSSASDAQDHIWVLHRPRSCARGRKTGPPVMEFDAAGNYVRGWGGPGEGYDWPESRARHLRRSPGLRLDRRPGRRRSDPRSSRKTASS